MGCGESVPTGLIPPPVLEGINALAGELGYVSVDEKWGTVGAPAELRADVAAPEASSTGSGRAGTAIATSLLAQRLHDGLAGIDAAFQARWAKCLDGGFTLAIRSPSSSDEQCWQVDLARGRLVQVQRELADQDESDWGVVGSPRAWESVLSGERNLSAALRACELRYCDTGDIAIPTTSARIAMLSELLGVTPRERTEERLAALASPVSSVSV